MCFQGHETKKKRVFEHIKKNSTDTVFSSTERKKKKKPFVFEHIQDKNYFCILLIYCIY